MTGFKPFETQQKLADFWSSRPVPRILNLSGCGTGKTLGTIHTIKTNWPGARVLVLAPLSILKPAWAKDIAFGWPETTVAVAYASNREKAFNSGAQWVVTNHDAIKAVVKNGWDKQFDILVVDEADAFRNRTTDRSKAIQMAAYNIPGVEIMTGTPTPNSVTDIWHLAFLVDRGERLGKNFFEFRGQVCTPAPVRGAPPGAMEWHDKEGANDIVTAMLADVTYRVVLEDVVELPETITRHMEVELPPKLKAAYRAFEKESLLLAESGQLLTAVHAGARTQKLLQLLSGAVYDGERGAVDMHTDRHSLVLDLAEETDHALVAFNWQHQRAGLEAEAKKRRLTYSVIDGNTPVAAREKIVERFQMGFTQVLFAHPQSAGHGLTLTKANRVIWASPTYRADLYEQFNHRIIRPGQQRKTEIIHIAACDSVELKVYDILMGKSGRMKDLLAAVADMAKVA